MSKRDVLSTTANFVADSSRERESISMFFQALDTPISLAADMLFREGEHDQLLSLDIDPNLYQMGDADRFHRDYLAVSFLSKYDGLKTSYDKEAKAYEKFHKMEGHCRETNLRFKSWTELENSEHAVLLFVMRHKIDLILGEFSAVDFFEKAAWGPGVSTLIKGQDTSAARKFQEETGITSDAYSLMGSSLGAAYPLWLGDEPLGDSSFHIEEGNKVTTVPKNSKTDRVIAVEPGLNLYFQKGIGAMIKTALKRFGIDLTDQGRNQRLALKGSLTGLLTTVDFSSASDSIAWGVVEKLLPTEWFSILNALRCRTGLVEGENIKWEKFSSMGNGFTFELESLLFYAAALACCEQENVLTYDVSVYGDDVIIPTLAFDSYCKFTAYLGFITNTEKTFSTGLFRESCGAHYFAGTCVKPVYHKKELSDAISVFKLANSVRRLSHRRNFNCGCDRRFLDTWRHILSGLPKSLRTLRIPEGVGDGGVLSNFDEATPSRAKNGWDGYIVMMLVQVNERKEHTSRGLLLERLTQISGTEAIQRLNYRELARRAASTGRRATGEFSSVAYGQETTLKDQVKVCVIDTFVRSFYNLGEWV